MVFSDSAPANTRAVPFFDLSIQHEPILPEIESALQSVLHRGDFILGQEVARFEEEFAVYCGTAYAIGVDSGLSALELCLRACGIGPGDEVITVAHTFVATASAISLVGATPIFVEVDEGTCNMDPAGLEAAITSRTRAIIPVHLYGRMADMSAILATARRHGLRIIEDACQAHGAGAPGQRAGSLGDAGCFSFYPSKNLGALGDGGIVTTSDEDIAGKLRHLRNYGQHRKYVHTELPLNRRLDTIQAAALRVKLRHLDQWNRQRRSVARIYAELLRDVAGVALPPMDESHVFHLYVVQLDRRNELMDDLARQQIGSGLHYPTPVHLQPCFASLGHRRGDLPISERLADRVLSLPMFPGLTRESIATVTRAIAAFVDAH